MERIVYTDIWFVVDYTMESNWCSIAVQRVDFFNKVIFVHCVENMPHFDREVAGVPI